MSDSKGCKQVRPFKEGQENVDEGLRSGTNLLKELRSTLLSELNYVKNSRRNEISIHKLTLFDFMAKVYLEIQKKVGDNWSKLTEASKGKAIKQIHFLITTLNKRQRKISKEEVESFELELNRLHKVLDILVIESSGNFKNIHHLEPTVLNEVNRLYDFLKQEIYSLKVFTEEKNNNVQKQLKDLSKLMNLVVTDEDRRMVHKAMFNLTGTNRWYNCRGCGDVYCVGDCGQVNQIAICSKCRTTIGDYSRVASTVMSNALRNL